MLKYGQIKMHQSGVRELAFEYCRHRKYYKEKQIADWIFHVTYSCEGDSISVLEKEIK